MIILTVNYWNYLSSIYSMLDLVLVISTHVIHVILSILPTSNYVSGWSSYLLSVPIVSA